MRGLRSCVAKRAVVCVANIYIYIYIVCVRVACVCVCERERESGLVLGVGL